MMDFAKELKQLINKHSQENVSNTPDFILAQFMLACLAAWNTGFQQRETWYGRDARPSFLCPEPQAGAGETVIKPSGWNRMTTPPRKPTAAAIPPPDPEAVCIAQEAARRGEGQTIDEMLRHLDDIEAVTKAFIESGGSPGYILVEVQKARRVLIGGEPLAAADTPITVSETKRRATEVLEAIEAYERGESKPLRDVIDELKAKLAAAETQEVEPEQ